MLTRQPENHGSSWVVLQKIQRKQFEREVPSHAFLGNHFKQPGNQYNLTSHLSFFQSLYLSFPHHVQDLLSLSRSPSGLQRKKAHPRLRQSFDEAVIVFDQIFEILDLP